MTLSRFSRRKLLARYVRILGAILLTWTVLEASYVHWRILTAERAPVPAVGAEKIYITSIHWNNEAILRSHFLSALDGLVTELGPTNVFVSMLESGSVDNTKGALREFEVRLTERGIAHRIVLDNTTHADVVARRQPASDTGWIATPSNGTQPRRIPYLAELRNRAMEPLYEQHARGVMYEKILFLNDIIFRREDVRELLATREGRYAAACAMDFMHPPAFYDTFATRDADGHAAVMHTWPYFRAAESRQQMMAHQPVAMQSCWNGMVTMNARAFYPHPVERLEFRGIPDQLADLHLEGSECCLVHTDNFLSAELGVWMNPRVRVGYNLAAYEAVNPTSTSWVSMSAIVRGTWVNRLLRWTTSTRGHDRKVRHRVVRWWPQMRSEQWVGEVCLIDEMQILRANGWAHV